MGVRPYEPRHTPGVVALHRRAMLGGSEPSPPFAAYLDSFYGETLFAHPWSDDDLPSLVYETDDGTVVGFIAVVPRPMTLRGRRLRAAVPVRFMVDREHPRAAFAGAALHKRLVQGPQDLLLLDNDNAASRRFWDATPGATVLPLTSVSWTTDPAAPCRAPARGWSSREADADDLLECIRTAAQRQALQPRYDAASVKWLVDFLDAATYRGALHRRVVADPAGVTRGWYVVYANAAGYNGVLALHADPGSTDAVFRHLLADLRSLGGGATTTGRLAPELMSALAEHGCRLDFGPRTIVHSCDPEIHAAAAAGDLYLTRLEGEFC